MKRATAVPLAAALALSLAATGCAAGSTPAATQPSSTRSDYAHAGEPPPCRWRAHRGRLGRRHHPSVGR